MLIPVNLGRDLIKKERFLNKTVIIAINPRDQKMMNRKKFLIAFHKA